MDRGRRRRVPAFGEWNYYYYSGGMPAAAPAPCYADAATDTEACSDVWFRYSPPPRNPPPPPKKTRRPEKPSGGGGKRRPKATYSLTPARSSDSGAATTAAQTPVKAAAVVVRRAVDADLYQVPPPDFLPGDAEPRRPTKNKVGRRSRWMGCWGLSCVA